MNNDGQQQGNEPDIELGYDDDDAYMLDCLKQAFKEEMQEATVKAGAMAETVSNAPYKPSRRFERNLAKSLGVSVRDIRRERKRVMAMREKVGLTAPKPSIYKTVGFKQTALVACVMLAIFFTGFITYDYVIPTIATIRRTIITFYDDHGTLYAGGNEIVVIGTKYNVNYLPKNYEITGMEAAKGVKTYYVENIEDFSEFQIIYSEEPLEYGEDAVVAMPIDIKGNEGYLYATEEGECALLWHIGSDNLMLVGDINASTMFDVAKGIKRK